MTRKAQGTTWGDPEKFHRRSEKTPFRNAPAVPRSFTLRLESCRRRLTRRSRSRLRLASHTYIRRRPLRRPTAGRLCASDRGPQPRARGQACTWPVLRGRARAFYKLTGVPTAPRGPRSRMHAAGRVRAVARAARRQAGQECGCWAAAGAPRLRFRGEGLSLPCNWRPAPSGIRRAHRNAVRVGGLAARGDAVVGHSARAAALRGAWKAAVDPDERSVGCAQPGARCRASAPWWRVESADGRMVRRQARWITRRVRGVIVRTGVIP